jgi:hypothetical protein
VSAKPQVKPSPAKKATTKIAKKALVRATATVLKENPTPYRFTPAPAARQSVHASVESLRFIDLFCGIGGFRIAFEKVGGKCVFSSDYDKFSQQTYKANFGELPHGDINQVDVATIPLHDILCAGFPCQSFSIAGVSKKNILGRLHGFDDVKQGPIFLDRGYPRPSQASCLCS